MPAKIDRTGECRMMNCGMEAEIIEYKNSNDITVRFDNGVISEHKSYKSFCAGKITYKNYIENARNRVGERRIMSCGMEAEIIEYNKADDITVKFDDGAISRHKNYCTFKRGEIANPNLSSRAAKFRASRIGERRIMNCGMTAELIEYKSHRNITVKFDDGTILSNRRYPSFCDGIIQNPNIKAPHPSLAMTSRIGERRMMNCGMEAEIIEYKDSSDITVKFSDTTIVSHKTYKSFIHGNIKNPNCCNQRAVQAAFYRIGKRRIMNCGMEAEIVEYANYGDITVKFDDATIVQHKTYYSFKKGQIANPNCRTAASSVGETALIYYLAPYGYKKAPRGSLKEYGLRKFEIDAFNQEKGIGIEYDGILHQQNIERDAEKNDLFFKVFKKLIRIRDFRLPCGDKRVKYYQVDTHGALSKEYEATLKNVFCDLGLSIDVNLERDKDKIYDLYHKNSPRAKIGEKRCMNNGFMTEIIKYRSYQDIDVKFDDGAIKNTTYGQFIHGAVAHPKYPHPSSLGRLGMRRLMHCGMYAKIIQYNKSYDIAVQFDDGTIVEHKRYRSFLSGIIAHPNISRKSYPKRQQTTAT